MCAGQEKSRQFARQQPLSCLVLGLLYTYPGACSSPLSDYKPCCAGQEKSRVFARQQPLSCLVLGLLASLLLARPLLSFLLLSPL
jgi:hypothetical protein